MLQVRPAHDQRIVRGATATLSWQPYDGDGEPAAPAGAVTVGVDQADGTELVAAGTATAGTGSDPHTYQLAAANNTVLTELHATWTDTGDSSTATTVIAVVGAPYFSVAYARAKVPELSDTVKYPTATIVAARAAAETDIEEITQVAFVPQFRRATFDGPGQASLLLPTPVVRRVRSVIELDDDGTVAHTWTADQLAGIAVTDTGRIVHRGGIVFPAGDQNLVVEWEHGHTLPPPDVRAAALTLVRERLNRPRSAIPDRATRFQITDGGTYALATAGRRSTGNPDVDAVLARHSLDTPGIA